MRTPESEHILRKLRRMDAEMDQVVPSALDVRSFRDLFAELDTLLKNGGMLPPSWITPNARTVLKPSETHHITDFGESAEMEAERLRKAGKAFCGHTMSGGTEHCVIPSCGNYLYKHHKPQNIQPHPQKD